MNMMSEEKRYSMEYIEKEEDTICQKSLRMVDDSCVSIEEVI